MKTLNQNPKSRGFALVVTLSLMILLTIVAVGLLALSSVSLRSAGQGEAMATARTNARLAMMLAIGELQKTLGTDKAITATSGIVAASVGKPNTVGVWESWNFNPNDGSPGYTTEKQNRFRRWLVSSADPKLTEQRAFVDAGWTGKSIELVGEQALGGKANANDKSIAGYVPVSRNAKPEGGFA